MMLQQSTQNFPSTYPRKLQIYTYLLGAAMLLVLLEGCGSSSKSPKYPKELHACELLTQSEAEALLGGPAEEDDSREHHTEADEPGDIWMSMCHYHYFYDEDEDDLSSMGKSVSVGLLLKPHGYAVNGAEAFARYEESLKKHSGDDYKEKPFIEGIGEHASWDKSVKQLTVFQGQFFLILDGSGSKFTDEQNLALSKQVAEIVLAKLPK